jgi:hypothetical protein
MERWLDKLKPWQLITLAAIFMALNLAFWSAVIYATVKVIFDL